MDQESKTPVEIGQVLAEKYRIERVLGSGGMGVVVAAMHIELERRFALKFLLPEAAANKAAVERFGREARASAKLRSDNIVRVTDVGTLDTGAPYMVMEYLEGEDLGQVLQASGPLPVEDAVDYVLQVCAGLAEAHAAGVIHRDLKPANLFLARRADIESIVKIVDFGISKVRAPGASRKLTSTCDLMGSPLYMSPEQLANSRDLDARTDIWSLGIILYEFLAGVPPFEGDTLPQVCTAVLITPPPPLEEKRPDLPAGLLAIVSKCLQKQPGDRYASVGELAHALAEFAPPRASVTLERISRLSPDMPREPRSTPSQRPHLELVVQTPSQSQVNGETASVWTPIETLPTPRRSSKGAWIAAALIGIIAGIGGGVVLSRDPTALRALRPAPVAAAANTAAPVAATTGTPIVSASAAPPAPTAATIVTATTQPSAAPSASAPRKSLVVKTALRAPTPPPPPVVPAIAPEPTTTATVAPAPTASAPPPTPPSPYDE